MDQPGQQRPVPDPAETTPRRTSWSLQGKFPWQAVAAVPPLLVPHLSMCACGYYDRSALPFAFAAAALSWWAFARKDVAPFWHLLDAVLLIFASLILLKNLADVLWLGHEPILASAP